MNQRLSTIRKFFEQKNSRRDFWLAFIFTIIFTLQPTLFVRPINFFELGLYLPGIQALQNGLMLYKDVFHLRGPLDIVWPWSVMQIFGMQVYVLEFYFYICSVLGILLVIYLGWELIRNRFVFWLFVPVVIARTFPKVVVAYWGGMRFVLGLLTIAFLIRYVKKNQTISLFLAGFCSGLALMTSLDVGVVSILTLIAFIIIDYLVKPRKEFIRDLSVLGIGYFLVVGSVLMWIVFSGAFREYLNATSTIIFHMRDVVVQTKAVPNTISGFFQALFNPSHDHFKHFTPFYLYLLVLGILIKNIFSKKSIVLNINICIVTVYGFLLFIASFQNIEAAHFEMALQPEKILLFFCIGMGIDWICNRVNIKNSDFIIFIVIILGFSISSWGFAFSHMTKKFDVFKFTLKHKKNNNLSEYVSNDSYLKINGLSGLKMPVSQAESLESLNIFKLSNFSNNDRVLLFPEMGTEYFLLNQSWIGRFPVTSFTWFNDAWHKEWMDDLQQNKPQWVVFPYEFDLKYEEIYFRQPANRIKFNEVVLFVSENYKLVKVDKYWRFYKRK